MTIPYPLIGPESYGLGSSSRRSSSPRSLDRSHVEAAFKDMKNGSQEHLDSCSKSSTSGHGWKAKFSRKYKFFHF
ncbi:uncharacterized protein BO80DRAFT_462074 [Aspergillus ibericus CBS 121593]|uniref:Uncharacterized protein n=1 Tax=Aspergillus ibericus CBS 121593 TaxID=1448316 RepID=A0A395HBF1_9EURO|nr:hypothetical protein BO80DRAFT_462074 [Aspergillus ibericus CBS 121593]RAL04455.1 hypothetical protein BO80DRAFT_462074 [Aspergillus ibericus CBS 121593]